MQSRHQGQFWIGGYEKAGDKPTGTLTSVPFKVTHPWASFLVGGGPHTEETCVELVHAEKDVIFRATGQRGGRPAARGRRSGEVLGQGTSSVRLVDKHTGGWGHINFDDFRFHAQKPNVPARPKKEPPAPLDVYKHAGLKPDEAAKAMTVPAGLRGHAVRRRARRPPADRVLHRPPRPAVGRGGVRLPAPAPRARAAACPRRSARTATRS